LTKSSPCETALDGGGGREAAVGFVLNCQKLRALEGIYREFSGLSFISKLTRDQLLKNSFDMEQSCSVKHCPGTPKDVERSFFLFPSKEFKDLERQWLAKLGK
jgi:hypothetical protein